MPIPATSGDQPFSARDAWVFPYAAGVPGTGKDLPGFLGLTSDPQVTTIQHRGDDSVIASGSTLDSVDLELTLGIWNLDAIASTTGGAVTTGGVTPNQWRKLVHKTTDQPADSAIIGQTISKSADGGGLRIQFLHCQPSNIPNYSLTDQEFNDLTVNMSAIKGASDEIVSVVQMETYAALTSTFPTYV